MNFILFKFLKYPLPILMEIKNCPEYIAGFCPNEEFYVEGVTIKCSFSHSEKERSEYQFSKEIFPFERDVFCKFKGILSELDNKIKVNSRIICQDTVEQNVNDAISECQRQIEQVSINTLDTQNLHNLLVLHGKLVIHAKKNKKYGNIDICNTCGVFKQKFTSCEHVFCQKYRILREKVNILDKKLATCSKNTFDADF
jgi:hypothetical protein